jgi:UDP-glucose 4-epimerase
MTGPTVWITGARGFIGRHVARRFMASGARVAGLGHGAWREIEAELWGVSHWINGDVTASNLSHLGDVTGLPDVIVHLAGGSTVSAAIQQPREDFFRTVATTVELLDWLRVASPTTSLTVASSAAVYGAGHEGLIRESAALEPFSPYGYHKLMMESLCRSYGQSFGLRSVVARLFSVYGDGLRKQLLWDACSKLAAGADRLSLGGTGREVRDWVHVEDVAKVLVSLPGHAQINVPVFNVGTGLGTSISRVAETLARSWGAAAGHTITGVEFSGSTRPGDPFSLVADVGKLARIGLHCERNVDAGLAEYVAWFHRYRSTLS